MKRLVLLLVLLFSVSFVFAVDEWGDINSGEDEVSPGVEVSDGVEVVSVVYGGEISSDVDDGYTSDFYIALGVGLLGFLIVALFVYLFMRKPKNRWK